MLDATKTAQLQELLENANSIFVIVGSNPSNDALAASVGLYQTLKTAGKDAKLVSPERPRNKFPLPGIDDVTTEVGNQNLCVSFAYSEAAVDKVSYHISEDNSRFFLTIKPRKGEKPLDTESVEIFHTGADADLLFVVGVDELDQLGKLYSDFQELFQNAQIISIHERSSEFAKLNLTLTDEVGISQLMAGSLLDVGYRPSDQAATSLLAGIESTTGNLQSSKATAETFEVVARLMRSGAERLQQVKQQAEVEDDRADSAKKNKPKQEQSLPQVELQSFSPSPNKKR